MKRKFGLFLIVILLSVQMFSFAHMAEHDFEEHEHNGQVCDIYLFSEHTKYTDSVTSAVTQTLDYVVFQVDLPKQAIVRLATYSTSAPRAPPVFS